MPSDDFVMIHSFGSQMEADFARSALQSAGVESLIQADSAGGQRPHLALSTGGFKLLVREKDAGVSREILGHGEES